MVGETLLRVEWYGWDFYQHFVYVEWHCVVFTPVTPKKWTFLFDV